MILLKLGLFALTIFALSLQYGVIRVYFNPYPIHKNAKGIIIWVAEVLIKAIISSWLK